MTNQQIRELIKAKQREIHSFKANIDDYVDDYNVMLDQNYDLSRVGGPFAGLCPSYVLRKCDGVEYYRGLSAFVDASDVVEDKRYQQLFVELNRLEHELSIAGSES